MKALLVLCLMIGLGAPTFGNSVEVNPKRLVKILDRISFSAIENEAQEIHTLAQQDSKDPIFLLVNSPGGSVAGGTAILDAMAAAQSRGIKLKCVTGSLAASMAFVILTHCDERYVLKHSKLLFHPRSVSVNGARVGELATAIKLMDHSEKLLMKQMTKVMGMKSSTFLEHYQAGTLWESHELVKATKPGFLKIVSDIKGVEDVFKYTKPHTGIMIQNSIDPQW